MELFKLLGKIAIDNSEAKKALKETSSAAKDTADDISSTSDSAESAGGKWSNAFKKIGSGALALGKTVVAGIGVAAGGVAALATKAIQSYADYEQLVGGVDTLFKQSSAKVQEYAKNAYKTAGLSANEYMETVTSFSASLLQSLGGDTEAAAEMANMAITDMSDNANKMGTDITMIQNAYNGFAKQNYTMLDNLKLGYGGTKEEMARLLADAQAISGIEYDISSYADVVDAIHVIQTEMGITGTTAKEASSTISGSIASMKSSWQNLLTAISSDDLPFDDYVNSFVNSVSTVVDNLLPRIGTALGGVVSLVDKLAPMIISKIPELFNQLLPSVISAATGLLNSIVAALPSLVNMLTTSVIPQLLSGVVTVTNTLLSALPSVVESLVSALPTLIPMLVNGLVSVFVTLCTMAGQIIQPIIDNLPDIVISILDALLSNLSIVIEAVLSLILGVVSALPTLVKEICDALPMIVDLVCTALIDNLPLLIDAVITIVMALVDALPEIIMALVDALPVILESVWNAIVMVFENLPQWFGQIWDGIKQIFANVCNSIGEILNIDMSGMKETITKIWNSIKNFISNLLNGIKNIFSNVWNGIKDATSTAFNAVKNTVSNIWNGIKNNVSNVVNGIKSTVSSVWNGIKNTTSNVFNSVKSTATSVWNGIKNAITKPIESAKNTIKGIIDKIKGFFSGMKLSFPKIKMPHFKISPSGWKIGDLLEGSIPKLGIEWYAKAMNNPIVMTRPTVFGYNAATGTLQAGGEAGSEVVSGTGTLLTLIGKVVEGKNERIITVLIAILEAITSGNAELLEAVLADKSFVIGEREFARAVKTYA
jgi:phage-related protein